MSSDLPRHRVALVSVRFTMFDPQMGPGFVERMRMHARRSADVLRSRFEVLECPLIETSDGATAVAARLAAEAPDVVVFAPAMAAPPSLADQALAGLEAPLVIWNAPALQALPEGLTQAQATEQTTTVGAVMYANVRVRRGLSAAVVTAAHDDAVGVDRLLRTVHALAVAKSLDGTALVRLGDPIPGYLDVDVSKQDLERLGLREVAVDRSAWEREVAKITAVEAQAWLQDVRELGWSGDVGPAAEISARIAVALDRLLEATDAPAGTVNCHGRWFRDNDALGVTACLGVACQADRGRSLSCTGDLPTAVALLLARRLSGRALYCECYAPDLSAELVLVAAGGEGDPRWAGGQVRLEPNTHYPGRNGPGTAVSFALEAGPATLLSMSPTAGGWVLAWATGEIVESRYPDLGGPNGMFRFDSGPVAEALSRWIASGATHHAALASRRLDIELPVLADALGVAATRC